MHTVELMELALKTANQLGFAVRHEWLGGCGGGACEIQGKKWLFIDLSLSVVEQLEQVADALRGDPGIRLINLPRALRDHLDLRRSA